MSSTNQVVGLGFKSSEPINAPLDIVWELMVEKVYHPDRYLPVTDVTATDKEGFVYREMTAKGGLIKENIYLDKVKCEQKFKAIDKDQVIVNKYYPNERVIEYWMENNKGERVNWDAPVTMVAESINKTKVKAEELALKSNK